MGGKKRRTEKEEGREGGVVGIGGWMGGLGREEVKEGWMDGLRD